MTNQEIKNNLIITDNKLNNDVSTLLDNLKTIDKEENIAKIKEKFDTSLNPALFNSLIEGIKNLKKEDLTGLTSEDRVKLLQFVEYLEKYNQKYLKSDTYDFDDLRLHIAVNNYDVYKETKISLKNTEDNLRQFHGIYLEISGILTQYAFIKDYKQSGNQTIDARDEQILLDEAKKLDVKIGSLLKKSPIEIKLDDNKPTISKDYFETYFPKIKDKLYEEIGNQQTSFKDKTIDYREQKQQIDQGLSDLTKLDPLRFPKNQENNLDYSQIRTATNEWINTIDQNINTGLKIGKSAVREQLHDITSQLNTVPDDMVLNFVRSNLLQAQVLLKQNSFALNGNSIPNLLEKALNDPRLSTSSVNSETMSQITWQDALKGDINGNFFGDDPRYETAFENFFDEMYDKQVLLSPVTVDQFIKSNTDLGNFKELLQQQIDKQGKLNKKGEKIYVGEYQISFMYADKFTKSSNAELDKFLYLVPEHTRVIKLQNGTDEAHILFGPGDSSKILAKGFEENLSSEKIGLENNFGKLFDKISDTSLLVGPKQSIQDDYFSFMGDVKDFEGKLYIEALGGINAVPILLKKSEFVDYLSGQENGKSQIQTLMNQIIDNNKSEYILPIVDGLVKDTSANAKKALNNYLTLVKQDPKYLGKDPTTKIALVDLLLTSGSLNTITDKDFIGTLVLQRNSAINQLQQSPETTKITLVEQAKKYISVIFEHPIGKMILGFLDDILGGKGGLKKLLGGEGSYFAQELDRQFAKEYGLSRQQKKTLESIDNYLKSDSKPNPNKPDGTPKTAEEIKEEIGKEPINILSAIDEPQKNLDVNVFHAYFRTLKPSNNYIYDDFFSADNNGKPIFKENIERDKLASLITDIINYQPEEGKTPQSLLSIATQTNSFIKAKQEKSSSYFGAKENITPYDPVLYSMMYLMAGSKGQGKFHYVVTENPIENLENKKSDFDILKDNLLSNINTIKDNKYNDKDISQYKVDSNSKYQTDILTKMKNIFTTKPENDKKPSYFEQILQDKGSLTFILGEKNIHLKNMLTLLGSEKDSGFSVDPKIIEAISTLTTIESDGKILTLSSSEQNNKSKITLSFDKDKTPSLEIKPSWGEAQQPEEQESSAGNQNQTESVPTESNV